MASCVLATETPKTKKKHRNPRRVLACREKNLFHHILITDSLIRTFFFLSPSTCGLPHDHQRDTPQQIKRQAHSLLHCQWILHFRGGIMFPQTKAGVQVQLHVRKLLAAGLAVTCSFSFSVDGLLVRHGLDACLSRQSASGPDDTLDKLLTKKVVQGVILVLPIRIRSSPCSRIVGCRRNFSRHP